MVTVLDFCASSKEGDWMSTVVRGESAKIYQFPLRGRFVGQRPGAHEAMPAPADPQAVPTTFGEAWYHEEAIREAEQLRKRPSS